MKAIAGKHLQDGVTMEQLNMTDRIDLLNSCIQKQFSSMESGYVRAVVSKELI